MGPAVEEFGFESGDYTDQCYRAAGWGEPDPRYWIGTAEAKRRLAILDSQYQRAGVCDLGRRHNHTFTDERGELAAV